MNLPALFFPREIVWLLNGLVCLLLLVLLKWRPVRWPTSTVLNAWMGAVVFVLALWLFKGGIHAGLSFHLLGVTLLVLLMGAYLALYGMALILLILVVQGDMDLASWGLNWLLSGFLPVLWVKVVLMITRRLPAHFFIYIFINAFLCAGISLFIVGTAGLVALGIVGAYEWDTLLSDMLPVYFLLSWSEAFITGALMAILVVYRPAWVRTFDDQCYLKPL